MDGMNNLQATATDELDDTLNGLANMAALLTIQPGQPRLTPRARDRTHVLQSRVMLWKDVMFHARGLYHYARLTPRASGMRRQQNQAIGAGIQQAMMAQVRSEYRAVIGQILHAESIHGLAQAATDVDLVTGQRLLQACERAAAVAAAPAANPIIRLRKIRPQSAY